jgi:hypothetical protein
VQQADADERIPRVLEPEVLDAPFSLSAAPHLPLTITSALSWEAVEQTWAASAMIWLLRRRGMGMAW